MGGLCKKQFGLSLLLTGKERTSTGYMTSIFVVSLFRIGRHKPCFHLTSGIEYSRIRGTNERFRTGRRSQMDTVAPKLSFGESRKSLTDVKNSVMVEW